MNRDRGSEEIGDQCIAQETARKIWRAAQVVVRRERSPVNN
jgi:hypothetical protein